MLCYAIDQKVSNIGSPTTATMYRNLHSDVNPHSASGFFQPSYSTKLETTSGDVPAGYGMQPTSSSSVDTTYPGSNLAHDYSSSFHVSNLSSQNEPTSSQGSWGTSALYPNTGFPPVLSGSGWETMGPHFPHPHSAPHGPASYPMSSSLPQTPLMSGSGSPGASAATLTGIECFGNPSEVHSSVGLHLSTMHPATMSIQRRPYEWINKNAYQNAQPQQGKTRTKDKYRVVYSDHQRLELEKEFRFSRYITIRRKAELAVQLGLSERQVKIWFQNRRAKERKANKKSGEGLKSTSEQEVDDIDGGDDNESEHSGHVLPSSPVLPSSHIQNAHMPQQAANMMNYSQPTDVSQHDSSGVGSSLHDPQDSGIAQHHPHMTYQYDMSPQGLTYPPMVSLDIKPIVSAGENVTIAVTSATNSVTSERAAVTKTTFGNEHVQ
ncbi:unnamed protein product [Clavelina lepadiformis]|uniref:Homeobox domain-containing protein n=1 Tax=Clavelina lepadiformis TaxID=159417 RepID=A0ABP0FY96_CLALP